MMTDEELIELKETVEKARPFAQDETSLKGVPWEEIPDSVKERIGANAAAFDAAFENCGALIDEVLKLRSTLEEAMAFTVSLRVQMKDLLGLLQCGS